MFDEQQVTITFSIFEIGYLIGKLDRDLESLRKEVGKKLGIGGVLVNRVTNLRDKLISGLEQYEKIRVGQIK